jgi:hypothetical protein
MTPIITNPKNLIDRYRRIQTVCDNLLARMEECFDQNLILDDPKELIRLEHLLKLRSKLLDFEREIRTEHEAITTQNPQQEEHQTRDFLISELIKKINQATNNS